MRNFISKEQVLGSQTAKNGFRNEEDVVDKFNQWERDEDAQKWLLIMGYDLQEIDFVNQSSRVVLRVSVYFSAFAICENRYHHQPFVG